MPHRSAGSGSAARARTRVAASWARAGATRRTRSCARPSLRLVDVLAQAANLLDLLLDLVAHEIPHRDHRDHAPLGHDRQVPAAAAVHHLEAALDALVEARRDHLD